MESVLAWTSTTTGSLAILRGNASFFGSFHLLMKSVPIRFFPAYTNVSSTVSISAACTIGDRETEPHSCLSITASQAAGLMNESGSMLRQEKNDQRVVVTI